MIWKRLQRAQELCLGPLNVAVPLPIIKGVYWGLVFLYCPNFFKCSAVSAGTVDN